MPSGISTVLQSTLNRALTNFWIFLSRQLRNFLFCLPLSSLNPTPPLLLFPPYKFLSFKLISMMKFLQLSHPSSLSLLSILLHLFHLLLLHHTRWFHRVPIYQKLFHRLVLILILFPFLSLLLLHPWVLHIPAFLLLNLMIHSISQ